MGAPPKGITGEIAVAGGRVTFARFMELALTHPTEGYYSAGDVLLGPHGDFSTAPALSPDFRDSLARLVEELMVGMRSADESALDGRVSFVELGGGHGELLGAVLSRLVCRQPFLRESVTFTVVEVGRALRARQRRALARPLHAGWCVEWAPTLAAALERMAGAVLVVGNEFIDALPVHLVDARGDVVLEEWVEGASANEVDAEGSLVQTWGPVTAEVERELGVLFGTSEAAALRKRTREGVLEVRPAAGRLLEALGRRGRPCCLITVDYGSWFGGGEPGSAEGGAGCYRRTLRGYFRHERTEDLLARIGRQDLTADVDFRALDLHGRRAGFETVLYTTVAALLQGDGRVERLTELRSQADDSLDADRRACVLQGLLDPEGVGGAYKLMLQVKG